MTILDKLKRLSPTDTMTEALVAIIEHHEPVKRVFEFLLSNQTIKIEQKFKSYYDRLKLNREQQVAFLNAFLFFLSNPMLQVTAEYATTLLKKIAGHFEAQEAGMLHCFHDDEFHALPLHCIKMIAGQFVGPSVEFLPQESNESLYYRFVELLLRLANQKIRTNHIVRHTLGEDQCRTLKRSGSDLQALLSASEDVGDDVDTHTPASMIAVLRERCTVFSTRTLPPFLAKLLLVRGFIFDRDGVVDQLTVEVIFSQVTLLLHVPHSVDQHLHARFLEIDADDLTTALRDGVQGALDDLVNRLSPIHHAAVLGVSADLLSEDFDDCAPPVLEEQVPNVEIRVALDVELETYLDKLTLSSIASGASLVDREITGMSAYVRFLWDYVVQKNDVAGKMWEIKHAQTDNTEKRVARDKLLDQIKTDVRAKHARFLDLTWKVTRTRFTHAEPPYTELPGEGKYKHDYPYSIVPGTSCKDTKKQARATVEATKIIRGKLVGRPFHVREGAPVLLVEEEVNTCYSRGTIWLDGVGQLNVVALSGRQDAPAGGLKTRGFVNALGSEQPFHKLDYLEDEGAISARTVVADYPQHFKPFLFLLNHTLDKLHAVPCDAIDSTIPRPLCEIFAKLRTEIVRSDLSAELRAAFSEILCDVLVTPTFRAKKALLICVIDESDAPTMISLCDRLNGMQSGVICGVMDELPNNENQLLSALLRMNQNVESVLPNQSVDTTHTTSSCAELSIFPGIGVLTSLFQASPRGIFNAPITDKHNELHGVEMEGVGVLWKPCSKSCDHRRSVDLMLCEFARHSKIWEDFIEVLYDGQVPRVLTGLSKLLGKDGSKAGHHILGRNPRFVRWAADHANPEFRALVSDVRLEEQVDVPPLVRTVSTNSTDSLTLVCQTERELAICQSLLVRGGDLSNIAMLLDLARCLRHQSVLVVSPHVSPLSSPLSSPLGSPVRASRDSKSTTMPVRAHSGSKTSDPKQLETLSFLRSRLEASCSVEKRVPVAPTLQVPLLTVGCKAGPTLTHQFERAQRCVAQSFPNTTVPPVPHEVRRSPKQSLAQHTEATTAGEQKTIKTHRRTKSMPDGFKYLA